MKSQQARASAQASSDRRRGRPAGSNRIPLTAEERRARNAKYERERRQVTAGVIAELATALGCDTTSSHAEIIAAALNYIGNSLNNNQNDDVAALKRQNDLLIMQIQTLTRRLQDEAGDSPPE